MPLRRERFHESEDSRLASGTLVEAVENHDQPPRCQGLSQGLSVQWSCRSKFQLNDFMKQLEALTDYRRFSDRPQLTGEECNSLHANKERQTALSRIFLDLQIDYPQKQLHARPCLARAWFGQ